MILADYVEIVAYGLRHPMKLVPFATRVRMHVKAFPSRFIAADGTHFPTVLMFFLITHGKYEAQLYAEWSTE
ncbi:hypothetical protein T05_12821 [Trichinella murrelli]|uniref:Uncharacterized protein n=1 Tax=Trichinella murrelli TaxID=144512 RepID=A0A0V0T3J4_9BILA|nr:hypothetical protein T05_12821 [Trichinella murrelli]